MVGLAIRFDLGRYHATPWGAHVNEAAVEWPPSQWRLLRALYAVSRTHIGLHALRHDLDRALSLLAFAPPPVYELPPLSSAHTRHYYPSAQFSPSKSSQTDRVFDAFGALDSDDELRVWWHASLDDHAQTALASASEALGYLGRSESVCSARLLLDREPARVDAVPMPHLGEREAPFLDEDHDRIELLCVENLEALSASVTELRRARLRVPPGARFVEYAVRREHAVSTIPAAQLERPTLARFRVTGASRPSMRESVAVGQQLRASLQSRFGRLHDGAASPVLSGRNGDRPRTDQHRHAHYLPTPGRDGKRIEHLTVWAPEGFGPAEVASLADVSELRMRSAPEPLRVALTAIGPREGLRLPDLLGPSDRWTSLTPFGLSRHPKRRSARVVDAPEDQIRRELALRGLPEPKEVALIRGPWLEYRRSRVGASRLEAPRAVGARLTFDERVLGPIALGALSHFGLGIFIPAA